MSNTIPIVDYYTTHYEETLYRELNRMIVA